MLNQASRIDHQHRSTRAAQNGFVYGSLLALMTRLQPQLEELHRLLRKQLQALSLLLIELTRLPVNHTQSAKIMPMPIAERHTGIEANIRVAGDQWVIAKAWVEQRIFDFKKLVTIDRMGTCVFRPTVTGCFGRS